MATAKATNAAPAAPALPPNVSIFTPKKSSAAEALLNGSIFTRLTVTDKTEPAQISTALTKAKIDESFCLTHHNVILIFDEDQETHHEHFRQVCLALKDADIGLSVAGCVHDATEVLQAGFQLDTLSSGSILVIDLMGGDDDDSDDEEASLAALLKGESGTAI
ncbi:uncharacterized protein CTRU02_213865 [Colletotrichum truncatum]|uniref:Uncharacterized protein n=1 Tax=Colletotrichum truncatum TaxID=5467 RepID=A0ACC3YGX7_COLTU|nr:uncharacterized protein CTRU02_12887 [Colletotrichum truncatum]KAF6784120.1 hypothetical protein CTRU02_12887 [Colletotrichum truncatum]